MRTARRIQEGSHSMKVDARSRLAEAYNTLCGLGLFDYSGDVSVKDDNDTTFLIRRARVAFNEVPGGDAIATHVSDILRVDLTGRLIDGLGPVPIETAIHARLYASRPELRSVIHGHPRMTVAMSIGGVALEPVFIRGAHITGEAMAVYNSPDSIQTDAQALELITAMGNRVSCLLPAHGVILAGSDLESVCLSLIDLEQSATMQFLAAVVGVPTKMPVESIQKRRQSAGNHQYNAGKWTYYVQLAAITPGKKTFGQIPILEGD